MPILSLLTSTLFSVQVIDDETINQFIEQNRMSNGGPAVVTLNVGHDLNRDGVEDHLVAYTFNWDEKHHGRLHGHAVVAFISNPSAMFEATNIVLVHESELIFYSEFEVETRGDAIAIIGRKRTPTDAQCCPTAKGEIVIGLVNEDLRAIQGSWGRDPSFPDDR